MINEVKKLMENLLNDEEYKEYRKMEKRNE